MQNQKNKVIRKTLFASSIVAGAILGTASMNTAEAFSFSDLGSGAEIRAELLNNNSNGIIGLDLKCGEGKAKDAKCGEGKSKDAKCGEGKCGGQDGKSKDAKCGEGKCGDHGKSKDAKCGEGKCGDKKSKK